MTDIWAYLLTGQGVVGIGEFEILRALLAEQVKAAAAANEPLAAVDVAVTQ